MSKVLEVLALLQKDIRITENHSAAEHRRGFEKEWQDERKGVKERVQREEREKEGERWGSLPKDILVKNPYFAFFSAMNNSFL